MTENITMEDFLSIIYEKAAEQAGTETGFIRDAVKHMVENAETAMKPLAQEDLQPLKDEAAALMATTSSWEALSNYFQKKTIIAKATLDDGRQVQEVFNSIKNQIIAFQKALDEIQNKITFLLYVTKDGSLLLGDELKILEKASSWKGGNSSNVIQSMADIAKLSVKSLTNWTNLKTVREYFLQDPTETRIALSNSFTKIKAYNLPLFAKNKTFWFTFWNSKGKIGSTLFPVCSMYNKNNLKDTEIAFWIKKAQNGAVNEAYSQILLNSALGVENIQDSIFNQTTGGQVNFYGYLENVDNKPGITSSDLMYNLQKISQELANFQINFSVKSINAGSQSWASYYNIAQAIIKKGDSLTIQEVERIFKENNEKYNVTLVPKINAEMLKRMKAEAKKKGQLNK